MSSEFTFAPEPGTRNFEQGTFENVASFTLEESIEDTHHELRTRLAADLLHRIKQSPPAFFENLVLDLLLAMGYGHANDPHSRPRMTLSLPKGSQHNQELGTRTQELFCAHVTKMTADGGIDGIIHRDPLGLDTIYLQAKRWTHPVGEPQLRDFIGALHVRRARKGVFITTSTFTAPALRYIELADYQISLIDGPKLADLMIDYNIGVSLANTYEIKAINADYFADGRPS